MNLDSLVGALKSAEEEQSQSNDNSPSSPMHPSVARLGGSTAHLRRNTADQFADVMSSIRLSSLDDDTETEQQQDSTMGHGRTDSFDANAIAGALSGLTFDDIEPEPEPEPQIVSYQSQYQTPQPPSVQDYSTRPAPPPPVARNVGGGSNAGGGFQLDYGAVDQLVAQQKTEIQQPRQRSWSRNKKEKYEPKTATAKLMTSSGENKELEKQSKAEQKAAKKRAEEHAKEEKRRAKEELKKIREEKARTKKEEALKIKQEEQRKRVEEARKQIEEDERIKKARLEQRLNEQPIEQEVEQDMGMGMETQNMGRSGSYLGVDEQEFPRARSSSFGKPLPKPPGRRNQQYDFPFMSETDDQFEARSIKSLQSEFFKMEEEFERLSQAGEKEGSDIVRSRLIQLEARIDYLIAIKEGPAEEQQPQQDIPELPPIPADPEAVLQEWEADFSQAKQEDRFEDCIVIRQAIDELKGAMEVHVGFHQYIAEQMEEMRAALEAAKQADDFEQAMLIKNAMEGLERDADMAVAAAVGGGEAGGGEGGFQSQFNPDMVNEMRAYYDQCVANDAMEEAMAMQAEMREMGEAIFAEQQMLTQWIEEASAEGAMDAVNQMGATVDMLQSFLDMIP